MRTKILNISPTVLILAMGLACGPLVIGQTVSAVSLSTNSGEVPVKAAGTTLSWKPLTPMPEERFEHGCAVVDGCFYVFGGYGNGVNASKHVMAFDLAKGQWRRLHDMPSAITHMNTVVDGRFVWIAGGYKDSHPGFAIDEVWKYDVDKDLFIAAPSLPGLRAGGGLALVGRRLHYISGLMDRDNDSADHWVLNLEAADAAFKWESAAPIPAPRNQFSTVVLKGKIYVIGGQVHHDSRYGKPALDQTRVDLYDPVSDSWSAGPGMPKPNSHTENSTFAYEGQVYVIGGRSVDHFEDAIWVLSPAGNWSQYGVLPFPLLGPAARIIDGQLVIAGGALKGFETLAQVWVQDLTPKAR